ncbi:TIGR00269 family protein [Candidatus Woesearchaeota archaeon]|nr:TIGR00269 family protein [Candidatus Woesearchaeota archaeon]
MKCKKCKQKSVVSGLCKEHFVKSFERRFYDCIEKYELIQKKDKVLVAVSGGKDSIVLLYLLSQKYKVKALAIDEGIRGYREHTLKVLKDFCEKHSIELTGRSLKGEFGYTLDQIIRKTKLRPCTVCGILRRYLLNKDRSCDVIATGHNLDDEAQSIMMNIFKNQVELLARLGPKTGVIPKKIAKKHFIQRIKPMYFIPEREIMAYAVLKRFGVPFTECPYAYDSFRASILEQLNFLENKNPGTKMNIVKNFLAILPKLKEEFKSGRVGQCSRCSEPANQDLCSACQMADKIKKLLKPRKTL